MKRNTLGALTRASMITTAFAMAGTAAHAQFRASIQGTVTDTTGAAIPNATLTLTDIDTGRTFTANSNASGVYNFNALAPDHYKLSATAAGFKQQLLDDVHLIPEQANSLNVQLSLGEATTTVNVDAAEVAVLDTETASTSGQVDSNQIQHLPSPGRDIFSLVQLAPGVFGDGSQGSGGGSNNLPGSQGPGGSGSGIFSTENGPQANANGGQYETNGISIDGISTASAVWGGTSVITPTEDSIGSMKIVSNEYDAQNGRFSGAQIEITSKTGTNQFHGSLFFRANRPGLNAYQPYNGPGTFNDGTPAQRNLNRDTKRSNQYGGSIGGPILKDRLFAFFAYETEPQNSTATSSGWYDTAAFRALAPAGSIASTYLNFPGAAPSGTLVEQTCADIGLVENQNCRTIPGQGLNLGSPLTSARGTQDLTWQNSTNPGVGSGLSNVGDIALFNTAVPSTISAKQYNGRLDGDVTKKDHVAFAIYWVPLSSTTYNGPARAYNLYHHQQTNDAYTVIYNHVFTPTFLNEARANDAGWRWNEITSNPQEPFGLPTSQVDGIGSLTGNSALESFGAPGPSNFNQHTYTFRDVATKIFSNHSVRFGGELTRLQYLNNPTYSARPSYNFYNIWAFLNDAPHSEAGSFDPTTGTPTTARQDDRQNLWGAFIQDDWKAKPNLTINAGLRYSYFAPYYSKQNNLGVVQLGSGAATYTGLTVRHGGNLTNSQKLNFGPQFGFAFSPDMFHGKAVVRGGYGLNFNQTEIAITGNSAGNPPNVLNASFNSSSLSNGVANIDPRIVYGVASDSHSLFGYPPNPNAVGGFNSANLPLSGGAFVVDFQPTQPTIYTQHFSLDTQIDLGHKLVATVGYQGSNSRHLIVQSFLYANAFAQGQAQNPLVANVQQFGNTGSSNNNSLLVGIKHQMSHGFQFDAEFNYAKTMDTGSGPYYTDPYPYRADLAYGRSDFNYGKAFKVYGLWQPVFFRNNSLLHTVADGFSFSGIYNIHTGFPFTAIYNVPGGNLYYAASPYNTLRPAAYLGGAGKNTSNAAFEQGRANLNFPTSPTATTSAYFVNPVAPVAPGGGLASGLPTLPGVSRNSFNGPGYQDVDATVTKNFALPHVKGLGEAAGLEFRADAFNLFNQTNLSASSVNTNYLQSTFGQASAGLAGRIVNLQARFSF